MAQTEHEIVSEIGSDYAAKYGFHTSDEADVGGGQSGLYFPDRTPKPSLPAFKRAVGDLRNGKLGRCPS